MFKRSSFVLFFFSMLMLLPLGMSVSANPPPLPALPAASIIEQVRLATDGAIFVPVDAPSLAITRLDDSTVFSGVFNNVHLQLNRAQAVTYFDENGRVRETIIPIANSRALTIQPTITLPGSKSRPGQIVGAIIQPGRPSGRQVMVIALEFKQGAFSCLQNADCKDPKKVRFYYNSTQYYEYSVLKGGFVDTDGDQMVEAIDEGASISHDMTCVTASLDQICWVPYSNSSLREESYYKDLAYDAYTTFKDTYDIYVDFYVDDAVPDVLGHSNRSLCSSGLMGITSYTQQIAACSPNVILTASKEYWAGQPEAIIVVLDDIDMRAYRPDGSYAGSLPVGEYLVVDATPSIREPGAATVTYLINADGTNHYLIPSTRTQGFATGTGSDARQAGIRDGFAGYAAWGC